MKLGLSLKKIPIKTILIYGVGAGISGFAGSQVRKYVPQVSGYAEIAAGLGMVLFGSKLHPMVRQLGIGILIKEVGDFVEKNVPAISGNTSNSGW